MADPNRALFESVVQLLASVLDELVFVGGCTTGLFVTDPAAAGIRPTRDVDAIVDVPHTRSTQRSPTACEHWGSGRTPLKGPHSAAGDTAIPSLT